MTHAAAADAAAPAAADAPALNSQRDLLMISLSRFYAQRTHMDRVLPYITCASGVSLRLIDWLVTNYARRQDVLVPSAPSADTTPGKPPPPLVNLYQSYRTQLKVHSKQQFDPFRRRDRILFHYGRGPNEAVETTIGQLNFFRWMLQHDVLDYVQAHAHEIERDMLNAASAAAVAADGADGDDGAESVGDRRPPPPPHSQRGRPAGAPRGARGAPTAAAAAAMRRLVGMRRVTFD